MGASRLQGPLRAHEHVIRIFRGFRSGHGDADGEREGKSTA
jgi:hypothetical protein